MDWSISVPSRIYDLSSLLLQITLQTHHSTSRRTLQSHKRATIHVMLYLFLTNHKYFCNSKIFFGKICYVKSMPSYKRLYCYSAITKKWNSFKILLYHDHKRKKCACHHMFKTHLIFPRHRWSASYFQNALTIFFAVLFMTITALSKHNK